MSSHSRISATDRPLLLFALAGIVAYLLPWIVASNAAMTLQAWDLAEWTSLHPAQRSATPGLITPLLLRSHLLLIAALACISLGENRWLAAGIAAALAVAQLPPLEFLSQPGDGNYQQQAFLALLTIAVAPLLPRILTRPARALAQLCLAAAGLLLAALGWTQAQALFHSALEVGAPGAGLWLMLLMYAAIALLALWRMTAKEAADAAS